MPRVSPHTAPTPQGDVHHGPLPGESPGILRVHHPRLGRWGTITRTDMGVQQGLNLADSQPGTQCTPGHVRANGDTLSRSLPYKAIPSGKPCQHF